MDKREFLFITGGAVLLILLFGGKGPQREYEIGRK